MVKRISLVCLCIFLMSLFTACEKDDITENISGEKIHDDIPADNVRNVNISGNARSVVIKQGVTNNFEFYNADLDEDNQYEVEAAYDEDDNDLNIQITMKNAEASNDVLGSIVVSIPKKEFERIETAGEFDQIHLYALDSDAFIYTKNATVVMELMSDQLSHNITLAGSELVPFREAMVYFHKLPENVKVEYTNIPQNAINDPYGLLKGDSFELGSGKPIISINNAEKIELYVE